ncbi:MAG TPA: PilN domain-containing protein [Micropepsaceae bacterium]|nr:PilN domain-containing protein [Micropepsaceae bacterium]
MRVFLSWWFGQLAGLLPDFVTRDSAGLTDAAILDIGNDTATLLIRAKGTSTSIAQASADEAGLGELSAALREEKSVPPSLLLRLPPEWVLKKSMSFPAAARRDLKNLLGFEIDRETPFAREEIYWNYGVRRQDMARGRLEVDLFLVPRRPVDPLIEAARRAGLDPKGVEIDSGPLGISVVPISGEAPNNPVRSERPLVPRAAMAGAFALVLIATPFVYQEWAIASADATIASLEDRANEAAHLRQSADQLAQTGDFFKRNNRGSGLATLAAVTRALPDDSYLTAFTLRGTRLTLSGLSPSAAQLVGLFAHSPVFREPSFDSPVVGSENGDLERFTISVSLAQAGAP